LASLWENWEFEQEANKLRRRNNYATCRVYSE
jgi:hypothetical protein